MRIVRGPQARLDGGENPVDDARPNVARRELAVATGIEMHREIWRLGLQHRGWSSNASSIGSSSQASQPGPHSTIATYVREAFKDPRGGEVAERGLGAKADLDVVDHRAA